MSFGSDNTGLRYLAGKTDTRMLISPRIRQTVADTGNQTLAASSVANVDLSLTGLGSPLITLPGDTALLLEGIFWRVQATDASGKLQVLGCNIGTPGALRDVAGNPPPWTFPPLINSFFDLQSVFNVVFLGPGTVALVARAYLLNTDGAAAHTYQRTLSFSYRLISGVEMGGYTPMVQTVRPAEK